MISHIIKKVLSAVPILLVVSMILFLLMNVLPGDAAAGIANIDAGEEYIQKIREEMGLNRSAVVRYFDWIKDILRGNFGTSLITKQSVAEKIKLRLPVTLEITLLAIAVSLLIALPAGIISAIRRNSPLDMTTSVLSMIGVALPPFWLGMLLILLFSVTLGWLPASGFVAMNKNLGANLLRMIMPAISVGAGFAATVMRQTRSSLLEVLDQDYIVTAKAKGLKGSTIIWGHALRNSLIPVITVIAMQIGRMIGGVVVCETVFAVPGIGREIVDSILSRDYPVTMGLILCVAAIIVLINTLIDVIYVIIDPRISHKTKA